jgi:RimJ/RimL family protein N-acetyltransferase
MENAKLLLNNLKNTSIELIGTRVKLAPLEEAHTKGLFKAGQAPDIWSYMPMKIETLEEMVHLVQGALLAKEKGTEFPFVIIDQETDQIVGSTRFLDISPSHRHLEIGWTWLAPVVWRTKINTEAKYLLLRYCFEVLSTIRVQLKTDGRNLRSQSAIERIGAKREGTLRRQRVMYDGYVRDTVYFSIIEEEWPEVKQRLEAILT